MGMVATARMNEHRERFGMEVTPQNWGRLLQRTAAMLQEDIENWMVC